MLTPNAVFLDLVGNLYIPPPFKMLNLSLNK